MEKPLRLYSAKAILNTSSYVAQKCTSRPSVMYEGNSR